MNLGLLDKQTWTAMVLKVYKFTLSAAHKTLVKREVPLAAADPAILPWTSLHGRTLQGEFFRLDEGAIVIRKNGAEFTLPFTKLKPESGAKVKKLGAGASSH